MSAKPGRSAGRLIGVAAILTAASVVLVLGTSIPLGTEQWHWPRVNEPALGGVAGPLAVYALLLALLLFAWRRVARWRRSAEAAVVALLAGLAFAAQLAVAAQSPGGYQEAILALTQRGPNRYHETARAMDERGERLGAVVASYHEWMRDERHPLIITNPAGPLTLFWTLNHVFAGEEAAAKRFVRRCEDWLGSGLRLRESPWAGGLLGGVGAAELAGAWLAALLLQAVASLVVVPVYLLARQLYGRRAGLTAAALAAATPGLLLFSPGLDQSYPTVAVTVWWLSWSAGRRRSGSRAALAGLVVSAGLFFSLVFAVVAFLAVLLAVAGLRRGDRPAGRRGVGTLFALAAVGALAPLVGLYVAFGYDSPAVWRACLEANATFNARRVYWKWVVINPADFLAFLGVPVACLFVRRFFSEARELGRRRTAGRDWATLALGGLLLALDLVGGNRGEVARLWMFLMPACAVAAAAEIERCAPYRRAVFVVLFVVQCVQVVLFKASLDVLLGLYRDLGG